MSRTTLGVALISMMVGSILSYGPPVLGQAEAPAIGFFGSYKVAADKVDPAKLAQLPIVGAWRMNFEKSDPSMKAAGRFKPTATTIYAAENDGIRHSIFNSYPPTVNNYTTVFTPEARAYWAKLDGKGIYKDPQGPNGLGQTAGLWLIDRNTVFRERWVKGEVDERTLYRVSPDGRTLTWTNFPAEGNSSHVVWDRITLP